MKSYNSVLKTPVAFLAFLMRRNKLKQSIVPMLPFPSKLTFFHAHPLKELMVSDWDDVGRAESCPPKCLQWGRAFCSTSWPTTCPTWDGCIIARTTSDPTGKLGTFKERKQSGKKRKRKHISLPFVSTMCQSSHYHLHNNSFFAASHQQIDEGY